MLDGELVPDEQHEAMEVELIAAAAFVVELAIAADRGPLPPAAPGRRVRDSAGRLRRRQSLSGRALRILRCGRCPLSFGGSSDTLNFRRRGGALGVNGRGTGLGFACADDRELGGAMIACRTCGGLAAFSASISWRCSASWRACSWMMRHISAWLGSASWANAVLDIRLVARTPSAVLPRSIIET